MRWWLSACLLVSASAAIEFSCRDRCVTTVSDTPGERTFKVEGHKIEYLYEDKKSKRSFEGFSVSCDGWHALDSPSMPHFVEEFPVEAVDLTDCPPPTNKSLKTALAALNVIMRPKNDGRLDLDVSDVPVELLTPELFTGLENLTNLAILNRKSVNYVRTFPPEGFLSRLQKLRTLHLSGVLLASGEFSRFPRRIMRLWLSSESLSSLPATLSELMPELLRGLPALHHLLLDASSLPSADTTVTNKTLPTLDTTISSSLQSLQLYYWKEKSLAPIQYCIVLRSLEIKRSEVEIFPERFVAACPRLVKLVLEHAGQLESLPAKMLEGATTLKRLAIRYTSLKMLPEGFLESTPNLLKLDLSGNKIRNIPSDAFVGPTGLQFLTLEGNRLQTDDVSSLAPLTFLRTLNIGSNPYYNLCEENDFSPLLNMTTLKTLILSDTSITRICRDWREIFTHLENLDLQSTDIRELKFTDLLYTRDSSVRNPRVQLSSTVTSIDMTKEDYEASLSLSGPGITLVFDSDKRLNMIRDVTCNCRSYWLRRAVDNENRAIRVKGLYCKKQKYFIHMSAVEMCPEES